MDKRGQIYILAAILLSVVIYSLSMIVNYVQQEEIKTEFKSLAENFEVEAPKLINSVLRNGEDPQESFTNFTFLFTSYAKTKSPNFKIFYALAYGDKVYFGNFMDDYITIYNPCPSSSEYCTQTEKISIPGCMSNISAQISFDGLVVELPTGWKDQFETLKDECVQSISVSGLENFCVEIKGNMYNLSIEENIPKIFSLSRLSTGKQILSSAQGEVEQSQICPDKKENECLSCESCCWVEEKNVCIQGACPERYDELTCGGIIPANTCFDVYFNDPQLKPRYCNEEGKTESNCQICGCYGTSKCRKNGFCR